MIIYTYTQLWFIFATFFLLFELGAPGLFYSLAFSCGALLSGLVAFFQYPLSVQLSIFLGGSVFALFFLKVLVQSLISLKPEFKTNVAALIGKEAIVAKSQTVAYPAQVKVAGQLWTAKSINEEPLLNHQLVTIIRVTGVTLFVEIKK